MAAAEAGEVNLEKITTGTESLSLSRSDGSEENDKAGNTEVRNRNTTISHFFVDSLEVMTLAWLNLISSHVCICFSLRVVHTAKV